MRTSLPLCLLMGALCAPIGAHAALVNLGPGSFTPLATQITFDDVPVGTINPVVNFVALPGLGDITVSFAGAFIGQSVTGAFPTTISGQPMGPLALDPATQVIVANDSAPGATAPILSGVPTYNGPVSVHFSKPVAGVGLKGGYFDALAGTTIEAFNASGQSLGSLTNSTLAFEFYGLADSTGQNVISGISFYITGNEPAGFAIDNLTFGAAAEVVIPSVPEPGLPLMLLAGGVVVGAVSRRSRR